MSSTREQTNAVKRALKQKFPGVTFSVRQPPGWGMEITWEDGPTKDAVKKTATAAGAPQDPMTVRTPSETTLAKAEKLWNEHGHEFRDFTLAGVRIMSGNKAHQVSQIAMHVVLPGRKHREPRLVRTDRVLRYSPNSELISTTAEGILTWAADHIENVGLATNGRRYEGPGTTIRFMRCTVDGAIEVAAGNGRMASRRTYDPDAIRTAKDKAYRILADHIGGMCASYGDALNTTSPDMPPAMLRALVVNMWSTAPDRTPKQASAGLRAAAAIARENTPA